jgi:putative phosphoribosyl transferase
MRYFKDRTEAGQLLADQMVQHAKQNCAVLSLSEGGLVVGAEVARRLHTSLFLLATESLTLPRETVPIATMSSAGTFTYNNMIPAGELEAINSEFHTVIDQQRLEAFQKLNRIVSKDGPIDKNLLKRHTVIIVSDGFVNGLSLDVAADFLKPIEVARVVVATPLSTASAVDRMHILADEIACLDVIDGSFPLEHYYETNELPDHDTLVDLMQNVSLNW